MIKIDSPGWYIFLLIAVAIILYFVWRFLNETKRIQEKLKGMKSFGDIIDATNQALDEFNAAFEEASQVIEKRKLEIDKALARAEESIRKLEELTSRADAAPKYEQISIDMPPSDGGTHEDAQESPVDRVEDIKKHLAAGKTHEDISRLTGASIREIRLVERFASGPS